MKFSVHFLPQDQTASVPEGTTLFNAANWTGLPIDSTCGGRGTCGKCRVRVLAGKATFGEADQRFLSPPELAEGWRLSCRAIVHSDCVVEVPRLMTNPKAALLGYGHHVVLDPNVAKVYLELAPPDLTDQRSDVARVVDALEAEGYQARASLALWRTLAATLREADWHVTAVLVGDELIAVEPGDTTALSYALALDIGTTTVVGAILNLNTGAVQAVQSTLNRQAPFGADVISRISYTMTNAEGVTLLQAKILETINELLDGLCTASRVAREQIYEVVAVGNATMLHLLLALDPQPISVAPFIPTVSHAVVVPTHELGIRLHPQARLATLPHLGAYVGADIVAGILATDLTRNKDDRLRLLIDVGTNGEIVLGSRERTLATAAPAGPAFEGAQIRCGMRASAGAIEGVRIDGDQVELQIIGDGRGGSVASNRVTPPLRPIGIAGSGLVDAVAELYKAGLINAGGRLIRRAEGEGRLPEGLLDRLVQVDGIRAFLLSDPESNIVLTQQDIRALQFAKGSVAAGVAVLMQEMGVTADDLHEILLAGSFGSYINPESARAIGLVPWVPVERIIAVGNSAGEGAKIAALSFREREVANQIPRDLEYLELSGRAEFNDIFTEALALPVLPFEWVPA